MEAIEVEQTTVEDLVSDEMLDEMIKEALSLDKSIDFEYDHTIIEKFGRLTDSDGEHGWMIIIYGNDKNIEKNVDIHFYEHGTGHYNSVEMECTDEWDMLLNIYEVNENGEVKE